jgi:hypothetical protein
VKIKLPKPKADADYVATLSIAGAPFYRDGTARGPVSFRVKRGRLFKPPPSPVC